MTLAWGGYANGRIPTSALAVFDSSGHYLRGDMASQFHLMAAALHAATGGTIVSAPGADACYRTVAQQDVDYAAYKAGTSAGVAAVPGTSNHGWGMAIDITGYELTSDYWSGSTYHNTGAVWQWLLANAARYGFTWTTGHASKEPWHWEFTLQPTILASTGATPIETDDDEMLSQDAQNYIDAQFATLAGYVRRESRARLYENTVTGEYLIAKIDTGFCYIVADGQPGQPALDEINSLKTNGYLLIASEETAQPIDQQRWDNIIAKCLTARTAIADLVTASGTSPLAGPEINYGQIASSLATNEAFLAAVGGAARGAIVK